MMQINEFNHKLSNSLSSEQAGIAKLISDMEYKALPHDLTDIVMQSIAPNSEPWWHCVISWLMTPRTIRIPPLVPVSALAGFILFIIVFAGGIPVNLYTNLYTNLNSDAETDQSVQTASSENQFVNVVFTVNIANAKEVALIGSFNNWQGNYHKLIPSDEEGKWTISIALEQGVHEYAFIVDGKRIIPDPGSLAYKNDGFGNLNSVILVEDYEQS